ncbi:MAG TPA: hypothetical protein VIL00_00270 [Pseudonocardiaceae bacterium]
MNGFNQHHRRVAEQHATWAEQARRAADGEHRESARDLLLQASIADALLAIYHELRHAHDTSPGSPATPSFGEHSARTSDILPPQHRP